MFAIDHVSMQVTDVESSDDLELVVVDSDNDTPESDGDVIPITQPVVPTKSKTSPTVEPKSIPIPASMMTQLLKLENTPAYLYVCKYCPKKMTTNLDSLYTHWQDMHKFMNRKGAIQLNADQPFVFFVDVNLRCEVCTNFTRIPKRSYRNHFKRLHASSRSIAMTAGHDRNRCALCPFSSPDLLQSNHFNTVHSIDTLGDLTLLNRPLIPLSESNLRELLFTGNQGAHKCLYCDEVLSCKEDFELHHQQAHQKMPPLMQVLATAPRYGCTICSLMADTEQVVVQHLQHHNLYKFHKKYQCVYCEAAFATKVSVQEHCVGSHDKNTTEWRLTPIETRLDVYKRIKIIFPNGLMVCKEEVEDSKWGDMSDIIAEIADIEAIELAEQQRA